MSLPNDFVDSILEQGVELEEASICFSVVVDKDIKKIAQKFNAQISGPAFEQFRNLQRMEQEMGPEALKNSLGLKRKPSSPIFKNPDDLGRIYPGYWAPVIVLENGKRTIRPMRYRVRPHDSREEIPSKYNVFNARLDSLEKRKTWKDIFLKKHALFPFKHFYEWVEKDGKKKLIQFNPQTKETMWAPALYDDWHSLDDKIHFQSFALITDEPPPEVLAAGHDRCPDFIEESKIDSWLNAESLDKPMAYDILASKEKVYYDHSWPK